MSISVLSDLSFPREILPVAPLETTFLCTFLRLLSLFPSLQRPTPSVDQTGLRSHYKHVATSQSFLSRISASFTTKGMSLLSIHSKGKILVVTCGHEHGLISQHHYRAQKGKTRGKMVQRKEKGIKLKEQNCILNC